MGVKPVISIPRTCVRVSSSYENRQDTHGLRSTRLCYHSCPPNWLPEKPVAVDVTTWMPFAGLGKRRTREQKLARMRYPPSADATRLGRSIAEWLGSPLSVRSLPTNPLSATNGAENHYGRYPKIVGLRPSVLSHEYTSFSSSRTRNSER